MTQDAVRKRKQGPERTYTRAPEKIPAAPMPATARPMIKATDVGAAPHMTRIMFSTRSEHVNVEVEHLPEPSSKTNIAAI